MPRKRKSRVNDAISNLTEALEQREKELEEREQKLREDEERFRAERSVAYGETTPSDVLHLNVGGTKTTVLRRTLTAVPGSMLASKFSGRWDDSIEKDEDGHFFIDQDFSLFNIMLNSLRNKENGDDKVPFKSPVLSDDQLENRLNLFRMLEYYGTTDGVYPTKLKALDPKTSIQIESSKKATARDWAGLKLILDGHSRSIKSFEVTLGEVQRFEMGWDDEQAASEWSPREEYSGFSWGIDFTRSIFVDNNTGENTDLTGLEHSAGTVLLSENYGMLWYVNGNLVFDASDKIEHEGAVPFIGIQGKIEITSVELDDVPLPFKGKSRVGRTGW